MQHFEVVISLTNLTQIAMFRFKFTTKNVHFVQISLHLFLRYLVKDGKFRFESSADKFFNLFITSWFLLTKLVAGKCQYLQACINTQESKDGNIIKISLAPNEQIYVHYTLKTRISEKENW